jgi:hypothetical protein
VIQYTVGPPAPCWLHAAVHALPGSQAIRCDEAGRHSCLAAATSVGQHGIQPVDVAATHGCCVVHTRCVQLLCSQQTHGSALCVLYTDNAFYYQVRAWCTRMPILVEGCRPLLQLLISCLLCATAQIDAAWSPHITM